MDSHGCVCLCLGVIILIKLFSYKATRETNGTKGDESGMEGREMNGEQTMGNYECMSCGANWGWIPAHDFINSKQRKYYLVSACPKCGQVQEISEEPFSLFNYFPRAPHFLFPIFTTLVAGIMSGVICGIIYTAHPTVAIGTWIGFTILFFFVGLIAIRGKRPPEVDELPYRRWEKYPEFVKGK